LDWDPTSLDSSGSVGPWWNGCVSRSGGMMESVIIGTNDTIRELSRR